MRKGHAMARAVASLPGVLPGEPSPPAPRLAVARLAVLACAVLLGAILLGTPALTPQAHAASADFATPEAAVAALDAALKVDNVTALRDVFGPGSDKLLVSGDPVADREARRRFRDAFEAAHRLDPPTSTASASSTPSPDSANTHRRVLLVGSHDWPLPIPLVETGGRWHFDAAAGAQEIVDRRIGQNEIEAIRTLLAVADAQKDFFDRSKHSGGPAYYARRFLASPGKHDGLYWPDDDTNGADDEKPSPLAPLGEIARAGGYTLAALQAGPVPFQGYRFRMLTGQGPLAPGGATSYLTGDRLTGGYAVLAWPAIYDASGIMSFLLGPDGVVYQTDLGPQTTDAAARITRFDPGIQWARVDIGE